MGQATEKNVLPLILSVKDTGIGISDLAMSRLFQAFSQVDGSATRAYGGTGLGLVISRQLALLMGGDVQVASVLGQGSVFEATLFLPVVDDEMLSRSERLLTAPVSAIPKVESKVEKSTISRMPSIIEQINEPTGTMKILLIEDNIVNQKVAIALLKRMGYRVEVANNGQEGLERLTQESFDAVLMDCQMPVMDGYEASRQIRTIEARTGQHMPIIALTAHAMKGDAEKCYEAGMDDYLTKPINHGLLKERLEYWQNWLDERKKV
jgi:CheY-like chemotaxis protein